MRLRRQGCLVPVLIAGSLVGGCPPQRKQPAAPIAPPMPMWKAVFHVNDNADRIGGTLRATGYVDGYFTDNAGRRRTFHVDGVLFFLTPRYLRFDLKKLGDSQVLLGSNETDYWVYTKDADEWFCGRHGVLSDLPPDVPVRPDQLVEALGLNPIDIESDEGRARRPVQRITDAYQQLLFLEEDPFGGTVLTKEFWLDRHPPHLIRRIIFRDQDGRIEMDSRLGDFRPLEPGGPVLPSVMIAEWPKSAAQLKFKIRKWKRFEQVTPEAIQFRTPRKCGQP